MKRSLHIIFISLLISLLLSSCNILGSSSKDKDDKDKKTSSEESVKEKKKTKKEKEPSAPDLSTEAGILAYLEGDWTLYDRENGNDLGVLSVKADGDFQFKRLDKDAKGGGKLSFDYISGQKGEEPDGFSLAFDDVKEFLPEDYTIYGDEGMGGLFHVGAFGDEDYLYLKEIGNGDSVVSMYVFNPDEEYDPGNWQTEWFLYRKAKGEDSTDTLKNDTFYAWAWERDESGLWLQSMKEHEYEAYSEYSNTKFTGGYFNETDDIRISYYELGSDLDYSGIVHTDRLERDYPLAMYKVTVDKNSVITELSEVDIEMYNVYDMGELEQEFDYKGKDFIINGVEVDMSEFVPATDAIIDCMQVGEWIIVECHINPHKSVYEFHNIPNGLVSYFEYEITGTKLTWVDDDLSTAVYERDNCIYDFWGHMIASVDSNEEIGRIRITGPTTVSADVRVYGENGELTEEKRDYEYEPCDKAVLTYFESLLGGDRQLRKLLKDAPANAAALIIVNPPEKILEKMPYPITYTEGAYDRVAVVSLKDNAKVFIESMEPDASGKNERSETFDVNKGNCTVFEVTVPEGAPSNEVVVKTDGLGEVYWNIWQLSGRTPQMSTYIIAGD